MRSLAGVIVVGMLLGCGRTQRPPTTNPSTERSFVTAIADSVRMEKGMPVVIDPHPLPPSLDGPGGTPTPATMKSDEPMALVRDLMATAIRAAPARERERCDGGWVFENEAERAAKQSGCPKEPYVLLVVGALRRDSAALKEAARRGHVAAEDHRWVRVLETTMTPTGRGALFQLDYIVAPIGDRWRVLRRIPLMVFD
jgi:hypothetical protein